jgi:hypothetical protein
MDTTAQFGASSLGQGSGGGGNAGYERLLPWDPAAVQRQESDTREPSKDVLDFNSERNTQHVARVLALAFY